MCQTERKNEKKSNVRDREREKKVMFETERKREKK